MYCRCEKPKRQC